MGNHRGSMIKVSEREIQSSIIDYLIVEEELGHLTFQRINNIPVYDVKKGIYRALPKGNKKGFPDIIILKKGRFIGLEIKKTVGGQQSIYQKKMENLIKKQHGEYYLVTSLEEAIAVIGCGKEFKIANTGTTVKKPK